MIDERLEALLNEELDGLLTPEEAARLRARLAEDPEARAYREELLQLAQVLAASEPAAPPVDLSERIMRHVRGRARPTVERRTGWWRRIRGEGGWRAMWTPRLAYTFAAGLALGLLVMGLWRVGNSGQGLDHRQLAGAMVTEGNVVGERIAISLPGASGWAETQRGENEVRLVIVLQTESDTVVEVGAGAGTEIRGIAWDAPVAGPFTLKDGAWRFTHRGNNKYIVDLGPPDRAGREVRLAVEAGGARLERILLTRISG